MNVALPAAGAPTVLRSFETDACVESHLLGLAVRLRNAWLSKPPSPPDCRETHSTASVTCAADNRMLHEAQVVLYAAGPDEKTRTVRSSFSPCRWPRCGGGRRGAVFSVEDRMTTYASFHVHRATFARNKDVFAGSLHITGPIVTYDGLDKHPVVSRRYRMCQFRLTDREWPVCHDRHVIAV